MDSPDRIVMYTTSWCASCRSVKAFLDQNAIPYQEIDIDGDEGAAARVVEITGGYRSVPTLVLHDGTVLVEPGRRQLAEAFAGG